MDLLARHAEALFWLGRYFERTSSLARILLVQTAFDRGRAEGESWAWLLTLFDANEDFNERYDAPSNRNVIRYFMTDPEHGGSMMSAFEAARSNARTLRAMIATELWMQTNRAYRRIKELPEAAIHETRLATTCEAIQIDCYALFGISASTLYRDAGWRFYTLGREIERTDQMSRLLDVRFAQMKTVDGDDVVSHHLGDFTHWSMLLRACGGHHAYRRLVSGPLKPENVARFLIFEQSFARSMAHSIGEIERAANDLRGVCQISTPMAVSHRIADLQAMLETARGDAGLTPNLHHFNDAVQRELIALTNDLAANYFDISASRSTTRATSSSEDTTPEWVEPVTDDDPPATTAAAKPDAASAAVHASQSQS